MFKDTLSGTPKMAICALDLKEIPNTLKNILERGKSYFWSKLLKQKNFPLWNKSLKWCWPTSFHLEKEKPKVKGKNKWLLPVGPSTRWHLKFVMSSKMDPYFLSRKYYTRFIGRDENTDVEVTKSDIEPLMSTN